MKVFRNTAVLIAFSVFFLAGTSEASGLVAADALGSGVGPVYWLQAVSAGLVGNLMNSGLDLHRTLVPMVGAIWLLLSGWNFLGWFRRGSGAI